MPLEFYNKGSHYGIRQPDMAGYAGLLYYYKGNKVTIVTENNEYVNSFETEGLNTDGTIFVNAKGVFSMSDCVDEDDKGIVVQYTHTGERISSFVLEAGYNIGYVYGDLVWCINGVEEEDSQNKIYCYNFATGKQKEVPLPWDGNVDICCIYGNDKKVIMKFDFKSGFESEFGWYVLDLQDNTVTCISHTGMLPHWVVEKPDLYEACKQDELNMESEQFDLPFFDLQRDLMWVKEYKSGGRHQLRAKTIAAPDRSKEVPGIAPWVCGHNLNSYNYFDGKVLYTAPGYYEFGSVDRQTGEYTELKEPQTGHGRCESFLVIGNYVFGDMDAQNKVYRYPNNPEYMGRGKKMDTIPGSLR